MKPILFSTEMVQAILNGSKTQTRRIIKPQPSINSGVGKWMKSKIIQMIGGQEVVFSYMEKNNPYGQRGQIIWVREAFNYTDPKHAVEGEFMGEETGFVGCEEEREIRWRWVYKASSALEHPKYGKARWKSGIQMLKEACRLFLKIKSVRVERLQDISDGDIAAEGVVWNEPFEYKRDQQECKSPAQRAFKKLWDSINGKRASWKDNPWVWCITFERTNKP